MEIGVCALCLNKKLLCDSHIIPNSVFKRIKKSQGTGNLIKFDDDPNSKVFRSQESWSEHLLCQDCEQIIKRYEDYGLSVLRSCSIASVVRHASGLTYGKHSYSLFKLFLTSIIWRAAVARQEKFAHIIIRPNTEEDARLSLLKGRPLGQLKLGTIVSRLTDSTQAARGASNEKLKKFIISPIARKSKGGIYSALFVIEGFLIEFFVPSLPFRLLQTPGVHRDQTTFYVPLLCIFQVPELVRLLGVPAFKSKNGLVAFEK